MFSTFLGLLLVAPLATAPPQNDPPPGAAAAYAAREAAKHQVLHDFWISAAQIVNEPGNDLRARLVAAWQERTAGLTLVYEQHQMRLRLLQEFGNGSYSPHLLPSEFSPHITNPYMTFKPGRTLVYERQLSEGLERIEVTALPGVVKIQGIPCRAIREYETLDGVLVEESINWISQRADGAVWYFGEIARIYEDGFLHSLDGSWRYGLDNAQPGILMPAAPTVGQVYRQEFLLGTAEDVARVIETGVVETVSGRTVTDCVTTQEETPIEPDDLGTKTYAPGIGLVLEVDVATGGRLELVEIIN